MRRVIRPAAFTATSITAIVGFVLAGRLSAERLVWTDIGSWLDRVEPVDALAEIARWVGLGLAIYVALLSMTALLAETANAVRMPRIHRVLHRVVRLVALPAIRRRLLEFTTLATITATSLQPATAGAALAPTTSISLVVESSGPVAPMFVRGEFHGFGLPVPIAADDAPSETHTVRPGDTLWEIIHSRYGRADEDLLHAVLHANAHIVDPNLILVGWEITLPDLPPVPDAVPAAPPVRGESTWAVVTVQPGDTLWDIVDRHYGHATAELVWATVDANPNLDDPNLVYPGQKITLPPTANEPPSSVPPAEQLPAAPPGAEVPAPPTAAPTSDPTTTNPDAVIPTFAPPPPPSSVPAVTLMPVTIPSTSDGTTVKAPAEAEHSETSDGFTGPSLAQLIGWTGGAGLAAALLGLSARRRRRLPIAKRLRRPTDQAVALGVALRETDNLTSVNRAANALRSLAARLRPRPGEPTSVPRLLRLDGERIELVWDAPNTEAPAPWQTADGGWSWTLEDMTDARATDIPSPCPCLVTVGRRDGADVLLNLESCGAISIAGDPDAVASLTRSIATELAASVFSDAPTILVVGGAGLPGEPDHSRIVDAREAIGWLRDRTDAASALLAHRRLTSLFALRARSHVQDGHEPVIVIVDATALDDDSLVDLINLANGDLGSIVVVAGPPHPSITWRLQCTNDTVEVQPLRLTLEAVGVGADLGCVIDEFIPDTDPEVDEVDERDAEPVSPELEVVLADHLDAVRVHRATPDSVPEPEDDWDVELKVLGQVRSIGPKEPLTPTELHLAIYLAFHRNGENSDTISTMVWPKGAADRTITNTMASLRRKLGTGSDGEMLFPLGRDHQYVYRLSSRVVTDWDRFVALTKRAEGLSSDDGLQLLDRALELIDGPPFRAPTGYSWAYSDGTATLIAETVKAVGRRCVELHVERGELVEAEPRGMPIVQGVRRR